jgi:hypothetical protein
MILTRGLHRSGKVLPIAVRNIFTFQDVNLVSDVQRTRGGISMKSKLSILVLVGVCLWAREVKADNVSLNPGTAGSTFSYQNFDFSILAGSAFQGQTQTLDIQFDGQFLVAPELSIELFLNQSGALGTNPDTSFSITGVLLNASGSSIGNSFAFSQNVSMPAQLFPGWPFMLNGSPFLPATSGYGVSLHGTATDLRPGEPGFDLLINPLVFSQIQLTINYPIDNASLLGSRLELSSFESFPGTDFTSPIFVSPSPVPSFIATPEPGTWVLLGFGLLSLIGLGGRR